MRFKIDENLPIEIAEILINSGHDAKTVNAERLQGAKDPVLIGVCKSENRVLVTLDTDFSVHQRISQSIASGFPIKNLFI